MAMTTTPWPEFVSKRAIMTHIVLRCLAWTMVVVSPVAVLFMYWPSAGIITGIPAGIASVWICTVIARSARHQYRMDTVSGSFIGTVIRYRDGYLDPEKSPQVSEHETRVSAVREALKRGKAAAIVAAYDRWYTVMGREVSSTDSKPVSFYSSSVVDMIPATGTDGASTQAAQ